MSVLTYAQGDKFIMRTYKQISDDPQERWSNTWEVYATAAGNLGNLQTMAGRVLAFEQGMTGNHVQFKAWSVSTWEPDSSPYNPENLFVMPIELTGSRVLVAPLSLEVCSFIKRGVTSGRTGKLYLRGALGEEEIEREGRAWKLTEPTNYALYLESIIAASAIDHHFASGTETLKLAMIGQSLGGLLIYSRYLTALEVGGVITVDLTHRWYNQPNRAAAALARKTARLAVK